MIVSMLSAIIDTHEEQYVFSDDMTTNTVQPTIVSKATSTAPSPAFPYEKSGKKERASYTTTTVLGFHSKVTPLPYW